MKERKYVDMLDNVVGLLTEMNRRLNLPPTIENQKVADRFFYIIKEVENLKEIINV